MIDPPLEQPDNGLIVNPKFPFKFLNLVGEVLLGGNHFPEMNKSLYHKDRHLNGLLGFQDA